MENSQRKENKRQGRTTKNSQSSTIRSDASPQTSLTGLPAPATSKAVATAAPAAAPVAQSDASTVDNQSHSQSQSQSPAAVYRNVSIRIPLRPQIAVSEFI